MRSFLSQAVVACLAELDTAPAKIEADMAMPASGCGRIGHHLGDAPILSGPVVGKHGSHPLLGIPRWFREGQEHIATNAPVPEPASILPGQQSGLDGARIELSVVTQGQQVP
jgi:hypothetical protein